MKARNNDELLREYDSEIEYVGLRVGKLQRTRQEARSAALAKRKAEIDAEVAAATVKAEEDLVAAIANTVAAGVPPLVIRDGVFFGNYTTWGKWRDRAGIPKKEGNYR